MRLKRHDFCSFCGSPFGVETWPRECGTCKNVTYLNPIPVAVAIIPLITKTGIQVLAVRRSIHPEIGNLAMPGGYINTGETGAEGACRELLEETGIRLDAQTFRFFMEAKNARLNLLLSFWTTRSINVNVLAGFVPNEEASECVAVPRGTQLCFPTHTDAMEQYLASRSR